MLVVKLDQAKAKQERLHLSYETNKKKIISSFPTSFNTGPYKRMHFHNQLTEKKLKM